MVAVWRMYSCHPARCMYCTVILHDACIVLSSRTILQETSSLRRWGSLFVLFVGSPETRFRATGTTAGYWNDRRKKTKKLPIRFTLNYRFGEVSMLAETVYFLRKNSINLSTFCGKESTNLSTFLRKRPTVWYFFTKTLQALQTLHIRE